MLSSKAQTSCESTMTERDSQQRGDRNFVKRKNYRNFDRTNKSESTYSDIVMSNESSHAPHIAALDLGTNSCRLLVASVGIANLHRNFFKIRSAESKRFRVIDSFARIVSLGEGVKQTGVLSEGAIERTLEVLQICQKKIKLHHVCRSRIVATEACRKASNTSVLLDRAQKELGLTIEVIPPQEEARLVLKGCASVFSDFKNYGIVLDIGGGSTEVIWVRVHKKSMNSKSNFSVIDSMSLPFGVVTLTDSYTYGQGDSQVFTATEQSIKQAMDFFIVKNNIRQFFDSQDVQIVTSSGTATTLGSLVLDLSCYDRKAIDGKDFRCRDIKAAGQEVVDRFLSMPSHDQETHDVFQTDAVDNRNFRTYPYYRLGLLASGVVILNAILDSLESNFVEDFSLRIADRGVREGILYDLIDNFRTGQSTSWNIKKR